MNSLVIFLLAVIVIAGGIGIYAWSRSRQPAETPIAQAPLEPWTPDPAWTREAGEEFASLSESARCDLVFAVADLQDKRAEELLLHALDDPSETVALAAAHVLQNRGAADRVRAHVDRHPGERAQRISATLDLLSS